jgi:uncharacterized membrane protein YuzA (DUF378 family)
MARNDGRNVFAQVLLWLSIIGALNWGLVGFFNWDLVRAIFGGETQTAMSGISRIIYAIVGLAGAGLLFFAPRLRDVHTTSDVPARHAEVRP